MMNRRARGRFIELLHARWMTHAYYGGNTERIRAQLLAAPDRDLLLWTRLCYGTTFDLMTKRRRRYETRSATRRIDLPARK